MVFKSSFRHVIILLLAILLGGCNLNNSKGGDNLIVSVYEKELNRNDLKALIPKNTEAKDSLELVEKYIQDWVTKELLLEKARLNIGDSEDIRKMVQEYENSLLVSRYLKRLVDEKAENEPSIEELADYYNKFKDNFLLQEHIIRGSFLKLRNDAPRQEDVRTWLKSKSEEDSIALDDYCFQNATKFEKFGDNWISLKALETYTAEQYKVRPRTFKKGQVIEQSDSLYLYFLKLEDVKMVNDTAPLAYVTPRIYKILRHQKKLNYLSTLKKSIYNEAIKDDIVVFYDED